MRGLLNAFLVLCLLVGLVGGSIAHAGEIGVTGEVSSSAAWLHVDGDADEVPADAEKNYPHHHNLCHGHDQAAPAKTCAAPLAFRTINAPRPTRAAPLAPVLTSSLLRPPIA